MKDKDKDIIKGKLAETIKMIVAENKRKAAGPQGSKEPHPGYVTSLRKLAAASGVEYSIIQKITSGRKNPEITTVVAIIDGLNLREDEFFAYYMQMPESMAAEPTAPYKRKAPAKKRKPVKKK